MMHSPSRVQSEEERSVPPGARLEMRGRLKNRPTETMFAVMHIWPDNVEYASHCHKGACWASK